MALLLPATFVVCFLAGRRLLARAVYPRWATFLLLGLVAAPSLLGLIWPDLLETMQRDPARITQQHEVWRLLSALFVQDGGVVGLAFNLTLLFLLAPLAEAVWGSPATVLLFVLGGILVNVGQVALGTVGAGNSLANLVLGSSVSVVALWRAGRRDRVATALALGVLLLAVALYLTGDYHWLAVLVGTVVGSVLLGLGREQGHH